MKGIEAIRNVLRRFLGLREIFEPSRIQELLESNENYILDLIRYVQLYQKGENALGVEIASYMPYHPLTQRFKRAQGESPDRVTLKDTGDFHGSFYLEFEEDQFYIRAADPKTAELMAKYGEEILGLSPEHIQEIRSGLIRPYLERQIANEQN